MNDFSVTQRIDLTDLFGALVDTPKFSDSSLYTSVNPSIVT